MKPLDNSININPAIADAAANNRSTAKTDGAVTAGGGMGQRSTANAGAESVTLTRTAADLLKLEQQLADLPAINESRVDAIRAAIESGNYQIDTDKIVSNLMHAEKL